MRQSEAATSEIKEVIEETVETAQRPYETARLPNGFLNFLWWLLLCGCMRQPSPPPLPSASAAAAEEPSPPPPPPPSSAAGEDQPQTRPREAAGGPTVTAAEPQENAPPQPPHGFSFQNLVRWIQFWGGSSDQPAPVCESFLSRIARESQQMTLEGRGELKMDETIDPKHPDCSREFARILAAADAALAAAKGQSSSSSNIEHTDSDSANAKEESSGHGHAKPGTSCILA